MSSCAKYRTPSTPRTRPTRLAPNISRALNIRGRGWYHNLSPNCLQKHKLCLRQRCGGQTRTSDSGSAFLATTSGRTNSATGQPHSKSTGSGHAKAQPEDCGDEDAGGCEVPRAAERNVQVPYDPEVVRAEYMFALQWIMFSCGSSPSTSAHRRKKRHASNSCV
jgi:hypothetical protein